ncbi:Uncharacterised protein [Klebsiella aerogenes]|nr:Uncharacterised protein [Klebsiella aerogenes]
MEKSPSLLPNPVKSKRSTAIEFSVSFLAMRAAPFRSFPQVKQCANRAKAFGFSGNSSNPASSSPSAFLKVNFNFFIMLTFRMVELQARYLSAAPSWGGFARLRRAYLRTAMIPASTSQIAPVTQEALSDNRKKMVLATSSGVPTRPSGWKAFSDCIAPAMSSFAMKPS